MSAGVATVLPLLRLSLTPGVGPVLAGRLLERFGSPEAACAATASQLEAIDGIGRAKAQSIARGLRGGEDEAKRELERVQRAGARIVTRDDEDYPPLLRETPGAPLLLYARGALDAEADRFAVAIVGSRKCSAYGVEQAERFAGGLAQAGIGVVSGGARGVDTCAHRAAVRAKGRTVVVTGCGLGRCYPPENKDLFDQIVGEGGALLSELPMETTPAPENFPARNRIISGMSLGVLVVEAGRRSGALITARVAAEDQGREVMAVPGRVDSRASEGCHDLIRQGAALVESPADVIELLESPARHAHVGTHASRFTPASAAPPAAPPASSLAGLTDAQRAIVDALREPRTLDEVVRATGIAAETVRAEATMLEIRRVVVRDGGRLSRAR